MHKHSQCTVVEIYELTGKHTYCLMAITIAGILVSLVGLVALYNKLGPRPLSVEIQASNCVPSIEQEKTAGMPNILSCSYGMCLLLCPSFPDTCPTANSLET